MHPSALEANLQRDGAKKGSFIKLRLLILKVAFLINKASNLRVYIVYYPAILK